MDVALGLVLKVGNARRAQFGNATFVERPALVADIEIDDHALLRVLGAVRVGITPEVFEVGVAGHLAVVAEAGEAAFAIGIFDIEVRGAAETVDELLEDLFALSGALLGHERVGILSGHEANRAEGSDTYKKQSCREELRGL